MDKKDVILYNFFKKGVFMKSILMIFTLTIQALQSESQPNPQKLLEVWDKATNWEAGTYSLKITKKSALNTVMEIDSSLQILDEERFYFVQKVGENPYMKYFTSPIQKTFAYYRKGSPKIEKLSPMDSIDESFENTSFSYYDISGVQIENNFLPDDIEVYESVGKQYWKIQVRPVNKATYGKLFLYLEKDSLKPYRMDYYSRTGVFKKILRYKFSNVPLLDGNSKSEIQILQRLEMTDLNTDEKSTIEVESYRKSPLPDKNLFSIKYLNFSKSQ
jgi:hypothetical protein